jgi:hypothetical protein
MNKVVFFSSIGIELRVSLASQALYHLSYTTKSFGFLFGFQIGSCVTFAWAGLELRQASNGRKKATNGLDPLQQKVIPC